MQEIENYQAVRVDYTDKAPTSTGAGKRQLKPQCCSSNLALLHGYRYFRGDMNQEFIISKHVNESGR